jgi:hypothetical protein
VEQSVTETGAIDREADDRSVTAQLALWWLRGRRLASLRWFTLLTLPLWLDQGRRLPDLVSWTLAAAAALPLVLSIGYGVLEERSLRAERPAPDSAVHLIWTRWDEVRDALWQGLAAASSWPWIAALAGAGPSWRPPLALAGVAWAVLFLLAAAETLARARPAAREAN